MKKVLMFILVFFAALFSFHIEAAALSCKNIYGNWSGTFSNFSSISLKLENGNPVEDGAMRYVGEYGSTEFGGFHGKCHANADGTLTMNLSVNNYGINGTINTHMVSASQLEVSFSISSPLGADAGSGALHK